MNAIRIDERVRVRSVDFGQVVAIVCHLAAHGVFTYSEFVEINSALLVDIWRRPDGGHAGRTPRYHYFNALQTLGFIERSGSSYRVSASGSALANSARGQTEELSPQTLGQLRNAVKNCDLVRRNFLVFFTGSADRDPWRDGVPFSFEPVGTGDNRQYALYSELWDAPFILTNLQTHGILWGIRQWCQDLKLIDELLVRPEGPVTPQKANILFPTRPETEHPDGVAALDAFLQKQAQCLEPAYGDVVAMSIPLLLYRFCPKAKLCVDLAVHALADWLLHHSGQAFVEGPSLAVLRSLRIRRGSSPSSWEKQLRSFLHLDGRVYSRLFVSRSIWKRSIGDAS